VLARAAWRRLKAEGAWRPQRLLACGKSGYASPMPLNRCCRQTDRVRCAGQPRQWRTLERQAREGPVQRCPRRSKLFVREGAQGVTAVATALGGMSRTGKSLFAAASLPPRPEIARWENKPLNQ